jgi:ribose transport system substrate-binding protein
MNWSPGVEVVLLEFWRRAVTLQALPASRSVRRRWLAVAACAVAAVPLAACGATDNSGGNSASSAAGGGGGTIAYAGSKLTDPFQIILTKQTEQQAKTQSVDLLAPTDANSDPAKQAGDVTTLLAKSPKAIIVNPVDAKAIVPAIQRANSNKVPVVTVDQAPDGGDVAMVVRADNVGMGKTACQEMGKLLNGKGTVLDLQGALTSANGRERTQGFGDCMKASFPGITVVRRPTNWEMEKATNAAQTILSTQKIDGIFWASDFFAPGIEKVLKSQNKWIKVGAPGHIAIVGIDGTADGLKNIRDGYQDATVSQPLDLYAKYSVQYAKDAAAGKKFAAGKTDHNSVIEEQNGMLADLLPAPLVTKKNVDDPTLWANLK